MVVCHSYIYMLIIPDDCLQLQVKGTLALLRQLDLNTSLEVLSSISVPPLKLDQVHFEQQLVLARLLPHTLYVIVI